MKNKIEVQSLNFYYDQKQALKNITLPIKRRQITALIGPSGCGKSTFLRCLNRMNDVVEGARETYIAELLGRVEQTARFMCSELAQERHARAAARRGGWASS